MSSSTVLSTKRKTSDHLKSVNTNDHDITSNQLTQMTKKLPQIS
jgi:hypothetical protein